MSHPPPTPPLSSATPPFDTNTHLPAAVACVALALAMGLQAWPGFHAALPGSRGLLVSVALAVLGLGWAAAWIIQRKIKRLHARVATQSSQLRRLTLVADHSPLALLLSDPDDHVVWANAALLGSTGWNADDIEGAEAELLLASNQVDPAMRNAARRKVAGGGYVRVCIDRGPSDLHQAKLRALWASLPVGVLVHDARGHIVDANPVAEAAMGQPVAELQLRDPADPRWRAVAADLSPIATADHPVQRTLATGRPLRGELLGVHTAAGALIWLRINTEPQRDARGRVVGVVSCFIDINEQRDLEHGFARTVAEPDSGPLKQSLGDHKAVLERVEQALTHQQRHPEYGFAVLCVAVESVKGAPVNADAHGAWLQHVAARLRLLLRPGDALARGGVDPEMAACVGDGGFLVVLEGVGDEHTLCRIVERLHGDLSEPGAVDGVPLLCTVSVGAFSCAGADDLLTAADVLRRAEIALADSKRNGAGGWASYDDTMPERVAEDQARHSELRRALEAGELYVVYQPIVTLADQALAGVEALLRWRHPTRGLVPPLEFIETAQSCNLVDAVGDVVLHEACTQFMQWQRTLGTQAPKLLALNLCGARVERQSLLPTLSAVLQEAGMAAHQLQLEFTEGHAVADGRRGAVLTALKDLGVRLALDDFGTGHSSLARLHLATVDAVKIDGNFVRQSDTRSNHRMLIEATVSVARARGMTTLAEGIETAEEAALMVELGCDQGQGFLFGRPMTAEAFTVWAREAKGPGHASRSRAQEAVRAS